MITKERDVTGHQKACFDYQTLGDELDKAKLSWRFYASQYGSGSSGNGGTWSSYQAVKHIYNGPDWKKDVISPELAVHYRRAGRETRELYVDHAGLRRLRPHQLPGRLRSVVGLGAREHRGRRASSGTRRRSSSNGTIGAASTTRWRPSTRIATA